MNLIYLANTEKNKRFSVQDEESNVLKSLLKKVNESDSIEAIIDYLFYETKSIMPCDRIGFALLDEDEMRIVSHYCVADYEPITLGNGYSEDIDGSSLEKVMNQGTPRIINDLEKYLVDNPKSKSTRLILKEGIRSNLTCPLSVDGKIVGLIFRSSRQPGVYSERHVWFQQKIAKAISLAISRAWRMEQIRNAQNAYLELLAFVSHELKSPLTSLVTNAEMLANGYLGELNPEQDTKVRRISTKGFYLLSLIREYLDLAQFEGGQLSPEFLHVKDFNKEVVEPSVELMLPQMEEKEMVLEKNIPDQKIDVDCDPKLLRIAIVNLLSNAVNHGHKGGKICLNLGRSDNDFRFSIMNEGIGFSVKNRNKLFKKFSRIDEFPGEKKAQFNRKGTGLGLYTAWRILKFHQGSIDAHSKEGKWAEFSFIVPQPIPNMVNSHPRQMQTG